MKNDSAEIPFTMPVSEELLIRLYPDTKPHHQLTTKFQKGLILFSNETELVGEGIGLGAPAIRYRDRGYFSGSSTMKFEQTRSRATAIKKFSLNLTFERTFRNIKLETKTAHKIRRSLNKLYMNHRHFRLLASNDILAHVDIKTATVQTKPVGTVTVTYEFDLPNIRIETEFNMSQNKDLQKIYLLNEQGSTHFRKYYDSNGTILFDKDIGAWETVNAQWARAWTSKLAASLSDCQRALCLVCMLLRQKKNFFTRFVQQTGTKLRWSPFIQSFIETVERLGQVRTSELAG